MTKKILFLLVNLIIISHTHALETHQSPVVTSAPIVQNEPPKTFSTLTVRDVRDTCLCTACIGTTCASLVTPPFSGVWASTSLCVACLANCGVVCLLIKSTHESKKK